MHAGSGDDKGVDSVDDVEGRGLDAAFGPGGCHHPRPQDPPPPCALAAWLQKAHCR
ncbi:hypothetical protein CHLRE_01g040476v5 [Chlamydomonas reinhardtii]|uniref:Uncharacterized protein n=1 Tax=Chlamydomonas reinhardtii TaxID=3055 RepID=A0A2K3E7C4_CHLRE|nr:uncharacterized protein CHLRE_01g040476v5 [Chlamydomonas reinhardtii]PNW88688.1 hypothetical protein CHLRE_01g040476v5 [Chlamydomonas reinhardtii]